MKVNVKQIHGNWDLGYSLDKHKIRSIFTGYNEYGHKTFDTLRTDIGEALYQLKYGFDFDKVEVISAELSKNIVPLIPDISFVMAMPPSKRRDRQPVLELAESLAKKMNKPCINNILLKSKQTSQMKDIKDRDERIKLLSESFQLNEDVMSQRLPSTNYTVLIVDDLFDSGTSLEVATQKFKECGKINKILVATVTRTHP